MQISPINFNIYKNVQNVSQNALKRAHKHAYDGSEKCFTSNTNPLSTKFSGIRNYFPNISPSFKGACSNLKRVTAYAPDGTEKLLKKAQDGSYLVDAETVTRIYYGKDAEKFLNSTTVFDNDTQIISPHDGELRVEVDGKEFLIESDGAVLLRGGKEAKITVLKSNPLVITSERKPVWYEEYCNNPKNKKFAERYKELSEIYRHFYDGHLRISDLGEDIVNKLTETDKADIVDSNHIKMKHLYAVDYMMKDLEGILSEEEMAIFKMKYIAAKRLNLTTKEARKVFVEDLSPETLKKMVDNKLVADLREPDKHRIYWHKMFTEEHELKRELQNLEFTSAEQKEITAFWKKSNKLGFDFSGLRYVSDNVAIYSLKDRVNNMTGAPAYWDTTSFVVSSIENNPPHPYIGTSEKHSDKDYKEPVLFKQIRMAEVLHSHSAEIDKHQTEVYIVTEGAGALTVIEDGVPKTVILKQGEGLILQPGVKHCVSAFKGKYEHLVCQIPSGFHYGPVFKIDHDFPEGYSEQKSIQAAIEKLEKVEL